MCKFEIAAKRLIHFDYTVNVPVYQRPYCWGEEEIERLLEDFLENQKDPGYFIGNIIAVDNGGIYDLIDGQQRFTTLWILCLYLAHQNQHNGQYRNLLQFCGIGYKPRLSFSIRKHTNLYLEELLRSHEQMVEGKRFWEIDHLLSEKSGDKKLKPELEQNRNIAAAFSIIENWIKDRKQNISIEFLLEKVSFQFLTAPAGSDENKLFIQINTNGTQLQHYDILKSELINAILPGHRIEFAKIWDKMTLLYYSKAESKYNEDHASQTALKDIIQDVMTSSCETVDENEEDEKQDVTQDYHYEYMTDFNTLLIHTLYIFQKKYGSQYRIEGPEIFDKEQLLKVFGNFRKMISDDNQEDIRHQIAADFIIVLREVKNKMDRHIIFKDLEDNGFELLDVSVKESEEEHQYSVRKKESEQLQRMLYHSNWDKKHFWLGLYIDFLLNNENEDDDLKRLEIIDNALSGSVNAFKIYASYFNENVSLECGRKDFKKAEDFKFEKIQRYWFYKLEYLLWKNNRVKYPNYKITSRSSVEHVLPQSKHDDFDEKEIDIHTFGNLTLLSVSENSSFSDDHLNDKLKYLNGMKNPPLKLKKLFEKLEENDLIKDFNFQKDTVSYDFSGLKETLREHETEMLGLLESHYTE
ncbi:DUF262 domain-containing protein [Chryseobacterium sp. JM1]|uniref:DUF262 domain-containing protein n=1 Tax=Chryseobacterium sp. JM1 TaxID=1233950 RepID=UPI0004E7102C|nr:DUF262 domain-containing HNH endonuclease family protein [Chryseobacterium sp. JM1]KFF19188.1 hypothetical protein IW22_16085 [Chryseobacterium sp. JM1]